MAQIVTLYFAPLSRALRALWMLEELEAPYELEVIDIRSPDHPSKELLKLNPMGKVPVIKHGPTVVAESAAICMYLAEEFRGVELSPDIGERRRGQYLTWMAFAGGCMEPAFTEKFQPTQIPAVSAAWGSFDRVMSTLSTSLEVGPWILGDAFSAADVMIGSGTLFARDHGFLKDYPALASYCERLDKRPAYQSALKIEQELSG